MFRRVLSIFLSLKTYPYTKNLAVSFSTPILKNKKQKTKKTRAEVTLGSSAAEVRTTEHRWPPSPVLRDQLSGKPGAAQRGHHEPPLPSSCTCSGFLYCRKSSPEELPVMLILQIVMLRRTEGMDIWLFCRATGAFPSLLLSQKSYLGGSAKTFPSHFATSSSPVTHLKIKIFARLQLVIPYSRSFKN